MDLHLIPGAVATREERDAVDSVLRAARGTPHPSTPHPSTPHPSTPHPSTQHPSTQHPSTQHLAPAPSTKHQAPGTRTLLLPTLHAVAARVGWISEGALNYICEQLDIAPADAYGVASFYAWFSTAPRPPVVLRVCDDIACRLRGAESACRALESQLGPPGTAVRDGRATWLRTPCLGQCDRAPAALCQIAGDSPRTWTITRTDTASLTAALDDAVSDRRSAPTAGDRTQTYADSPRLLARAAVVDAENIESYRQHGGYAALARAIELGPAAVIREVTISKLSGRGGAAFPTGRKWEAVARAQSTPHYVVCNADESEPGTFKDRVLMEQDPFAVVEAMTIAGFATGAGRGFIYLRAEYPLAAERLERAIAQARAAGLLGENILNHGFAFDIELRRGAAAYICGEETALFASIEGYRGEPRSKPPFPVDVGLFGKPTAINNVETLVSALDIVRDGGEAFARIGTADSTGTRLFCLSGAIARAGVYEVRMGMTLRELIDKAGGVASGRPIQAVLLGGAAGVFMTPEELDMPLSFEGARAAGATLGSGVVMVFDTTVDMRDITRRIAAFFREESCGQCVPCRIGTVRQEETLHHRTFDMRLLDEVGQVMRDASICGLGQTASSAVQSAVRKLAAFAADREQHRNREVAT